MRVTTWTMLILILASAAVQGADRTGEQRDIDRLKRIVEAACPALWHPLVTPIRLAGAPRDLWQGDAADRADFASYLARVMPGDEADGSRRDALVDDRLTIATECAAQKLALLDALRRKAPRDLLAALSSTTEVMADAPEEDDTLLTETFSNGELDGWRVGDDGGQHRPSAWRIEDGTLVQRSEIATAGDTLASPGTWLVYESGTAWRDYRAALVLRSTDPHRLGVMFRWRDESNYYRFDWSSAGSSRRLVKRAGGQFVLLAEDHAAFVTGREYDVEISARGPLLTVRVDGHIIFGGPVDDDDVTTGSVAFYTQANGGAAFDDLIVTPE